MPDDVYIEIKEVGKDEPIHLDDDDIYITKKRLEKIHKLGYTVFLHRDGEYNIEFLFMRGFSVEYDNNTVRIHFKDVYFVNICEYDLPEELKCIMFEE